MLYLCRMTFVLVSVILGL